MRPYGIIGRYYWQQSPLSQDALTLTLSRRRGNNCRLGDALSLPPPRGGNNLESMDMTRVPFATREGMDAAGQAVWDEIETSRGGVARNYAALLNNPQAAGAMAELGGYARFETPLPPRIKALAVLTAAREACGHYVWTVNQRPAKEAGLSDEMIAAILEYRAPAGFDADDATVVQFVLELLRQHRISDATFEAMRGLVGNAGAVDVLIVSGYYHTLAHCLQALDVELPEGTTTALTY